MPLDPPQVKWRARANDLWDGQKKSAWKALDEVWPTARHQRCWLHKTANILNKVPKSVQRAMKADLREVHGAPTRAAAAAAIDIFAQKYGAKYNAVDFAIWIAAVKSMRVVRCGVRGRSG